MVQFSVPFSPKKYVKIDKILIFLVFRIWHTFGINNNQIYNKIKIRRVIMFNRKFFLIISALGLILMLSTNCAARTVYVVKAPPVAKVTVVKTPAPYSNAIWVSGHWKWHGRKYVWVKGYWTKPQRGFVWVQGHWVKKPRGWVWVAGHWKRIR
jgi:hypothetical protein